MGDPFPGSGKILSYARGQVIRMTGFAFLAGRRKLIAVLAFVSPFRI